MSAKNTILLTMSEGAQKRIARAINIPPNYEFTVHVIGRNGYEYASVVMAEDAGKAEIIAMALVNACGFYPVDCRIQECNPIGTALQHGNPTHQVSRI